MWLANAPVVAIWLWFALRARHPFFFSAVNPAIETGGVLGESKIDILRRLPEHVVPKTLFIPAGTPLQKIVQQIQASGLGFPLIAKPNVGERGFLVKKLHTPSDLASYLDRQPPDFLIQEYVDWPVELAVMHHRYPNGEPGRVTSVCIKEMLGIRGDGSHSVRELMAMDLRSRLQLERFEREHPAWLDKVPAPGEQIELEPIGNHCRGTKFLDGNHLIDERLHQLFNEVAAKMNGINYGRFDLRCPSLDGLRSGVFKVMEYNGIAAEPAHIYDPSVRLWDKYRTIYGHWKIIYRIYQQQRRRGVKCMSLAEAWRHLRRYLALRRSHKQA